MKFVACLLLLVGVTLADDALPGLSWRMESLERGARQTAYQVLVASSVELLAQDRGDLWATGRIESAENLRLIYAGAALHASQAVFWKVRIWDERGQSSGWSAPATWTAGMMTEKDWADGTRWISDPALLRWQRAKLGYRSLPTKDSASPKWLQIDLGQSVPIESVRLRSVGHTVDEKRVTQPAAGGKQCREQQVKSPFSANGPSTRDQAGKGPRQQSMQQQQICSKVNANEVAQVAPY